MRNRTYLLLTVLAAVNLYTFFGGDEGELGGLDLRSAAIRGQERDLRGVAIAPDQACAGHRTRMFDELADQLHLEGQVKGGQSLRLELLSRGVLPAEVDAMEAAVARRVDLGLLRGRYQLAVDRDGRLAAAEVEPAEGRVIQLCRDGDSFEVRHLEHALRTDVGVVALDLPRNADLAEAVEAAGEHPSLARAISEQLARDFDFAVEARPGDSVRLLVEKRYLGREFHRYGAILAIRYRGAAGSTTHYRYKPRGAEADYFRSDGEVVGGAQLATPFAYYPTDADARASLEPRVEFVDGRVGALFRRPEGVGVRALAKGRVMDLGARGGAGKIVELELEDGRRVRYSHLGRIFGDFKVGDTLESGTLIGTVGRTGKAPRPQLRLELLGDDGGTLDPARLQLKDAPKAAVRPPIPNDQLERFKKDIAPWSRALRG